MAFTYNMELESNPSRSTTYRYAPNGSGTIQGITQINGVPSPCRVTLYTEDGTLMDYVRSGNDGYYIFYSLPAGNYHLVIQDDMKNLKQPKTVLVTLT